MPTFWYSWTERQVVKVSMLGTARLPILFFRFGPIHFRKMFIAGNDKSSVVFVRVLPIQGQDDQPR